MERLHETSLLSSILQALVKSLSQALSHESRVLWHVEAECAQISKHMFF